MPHKTRIKKLEPFIGRWSITIEMTEGGQTSTHHATDVYR